MRRLLALALVFRAAVARADDPSDDAVAVALFDQGRELARRGDTAKACAAFEAAHARVRWLGVELNLADCYAQLGRTASAWVMFLRAGDEAARTGDARAGYARERAAMLVPQLARVAIAADASVEVRLDGRLLSAAELGVALPLDPGTHALAASAPGHRAWSRAIELAPRASIDIAVPVLAVAPASIPAPIAPEPPEARRWMPAVLAAGGGALVVSGIALGLDARARFDATRPAHCTSTNVCDAIGDAQVEHARRLGVVATVVAGAGVAALVTAGVLYVVGERAPIAPLVAPNTIGVAIAGSL